nr:MAG TPA: hypothetical protein [Caudoviricetes sp.]
MKRLETNPSKCGQWFMPIISCFITALPPPA